MDRTINIKDNSFDILRGGLPMILQYSKKFSRWYWHKHEIYFKFDGKEKVMNNNTNNNVGILVCSCDKYSDVWKPMFEMFFKFWPDCPYNIYLMANHKDFEDKRITTLCTGDDVSWSIGFRKALESINEDYVFIIMEDYILQERVDSREFYNLIEYMIKEQAACIRTYPSLYSNEPFYGKFKNIKIGQVKKNDPYRISLQAGLWKRQYVLSIIDDKDSAWEFEHMGSKRSKKDNSKVLCVLDKDHIIFNYYCTGIIQGYWIKEAVELCKKNGVQIDTSVRPIEPDEIRKKRIHSERDFIRLKTFLKKTFVYDMYRAHKYGRRV